MSYLWLKAFHIAAVVTWIGGMLAVALTLTYLSGGRETDGRLATAIRRWDFRVTSPAILIVWALGLTLAELGGWFPQPWLMIKLVVVLALSALHGVLVGNLRRAAAGATPPAYLRYAAPAIVAGVVVVVSLVVVKPF